MKGRRSDLKEFKYAVFDMDGTVLDSMFIWDRLIDDVLKKLDIGNDLSVRSDILTLNMEDTADYLIDRFGFPYSNQEMIDIINEEALEQYMRDARPKEAIDRYLDKLHKYGIKTAIVTATDREIADPVLRKFGLYDRFDLIVTCTEEKLDKNTPEIYLRTFEKLGATDMKDCVVFEDALHCVVTTVGAGLYTVGVEDEVAKPSADKIRETADVYITSFEELL